MNEEKIRSVLIRGIFYFVENTLYSFKGPMRRGLRPIIWNKQPEGEATSISLISNTEINPGEKKIVDIVLLNENQLRQPIAKHIVLTVGTIGQGKINKFGEFEVLEHLGEWQGGKVP